MEQEIDTADSSPSRLKYTFLDHALGVGVGYLSSMPTTEWLNDAIMTVTQNVDLSNNFSAAVGIIQTAAVWVLCSNGSAHVRQLNSKSPSAPTEHKPNVS